MTAVVQNLNAAKDLFASEPLKHLFPALKALAQMKPRQVEAVGITEDIYGHLKDAWKLYELLECAKDPRTWFTPRGAIDPEAIKRFAYAHDRGLFNGWGAMKNKLCEPATRERIARDWQTESENARELLSAAIEDVDRWMDAFCPKPDESDEIPF